MTLHTPTSHSLRKQLKTRFPNASNSQVSQATLALLNGATPKRAAEILTTKRTSK